MTALSRADSWIWGSVMSGTTFNSYPRKIGDLLDGSSDTKIVVPQFQRGYSWGDKEVGDFWRDIIRHQKESERPKGPINHFLGPIVLMEKRRADTQLLDGQQRLATATILFSVLRNVARELRTDDAEEFARDVQREVIAKEDDEDTYSLELGETDQRYFRETIQRDFPSSKAPKLRTEVNINNARLQLTDCVKDLIRDSNAHAALTVLKGLRRTVKNQLIMAVIPVQNEGDAFRIFETLNDRGLRLSTPDLLLNFLMRAAKPSERKDVRATWTEMIEDMGKRDINDFLRHLWISRYGDLKNIDLYTAIKNHIEKRKIKSVSFATECQEECEKYLHLINVDAVRLGDVGAKHVRTLLKLGKKFTLPLLLSAYTKLDKAIFGDVAAWALVYVTRNSILTNTDSGKMETTVYKIAREIRDKIVKGESPGQCRTHIKDTLSKASSSDEAIRIGMGKLELRPVDAKYVVDRLANFIQSRTKEVGMNEANLEHVYPKRPKPSEWGGAQNQASMNLLLWNIGNLTIYGVRMNGREANAEYDTIKRSAYINKSEVKMTLELANKYTHWNEASIKDRAEQLAPVTCKLWSFGDWSRI